MGTTADGILWLGFKSIEVKIKVHQAEVAMIHRYVCSRRTAAQADPHIQIFSHLAKLDGIHDIASPVAAVHLVPIKRPVHA